MKNPIALAMLNGIPLPSRLLNWDLEIAPTINSLQGKPLKLVGGTFDEVQLNSFANSVTFDECVFTRSIGTRPSVAFERLRFSKCKFNDLFVLKCQECKSIALDRCTFNDLFAISISTLRKRLYVAQSEFIWGVKMDIHSNHDETVIGIANSNFRDQMELNINLPKSEFRFENCLLSEPCIARIAFTSIPKNLSFRGSRISGQLELSASRQTPACLPNTSTVSLDLVSSTISGTVRLRKLPLSTLDLNDSSIVYGGLELDDHQLLLKDEADLKNDASDKSNGSVADRCARISRQYEMLSRALPRLPQTTSGEDLCIYKMRYFQQLSNVSKCGKPIYVLAKLVILLLFCLLALYAVCLKSFEWMVPTTVLILAPFIPLIVPKWWDISRFATGVCAAWDKLVLQWMMGYGVRIRNILGSSLVMICLFAFIYFAMSYNSQELGCIRVNGENYTAVLSTEAKQSFPNDIVTQKAEFVALCVRDSLYYSVITFTTVGYGDLTPTGRLRGVAACEALLGAVMTALLTVVIARKYLRL